MLAGNTLTSKPTVTRNDQMQRGLIVHKQTNNNSNTLEQ